MIDETRERIAAWIAYHSKQFRALSWPRPGADEAGILPGIASRLAREGLSEQDTLHEITRRMMAVGRLYTLEEHIEKLFEMGHAYHREKNRASAGGAEPGTIDEARIASKDCPVCHGMGILVRHRQKSYDPARAENSINVYCKCPYGRKIRENHRAAAPDVYRRYHCLVENPWLEDPAYSMPPRRVGTSNVEMLDRAGRIKVWFDGQSEEVKEKWRRMATNAMPSLRNHPGLDDFVAGMIAAQHPEFDPGEPEPVAAGRDESPY